MIGAAAVESGGHAGRVRNLAQMGFEFVVWIPDDAAIPELRARRSATSRNALR